MDGNSTSAIPISTFALLVAAPRFCYTLSTAPLDSGGDEMAVVPLSKAIADLRAELQEAIAAGEGEELRFELDSVVLELEVTLATSGGGNVRVGLWSVVTAGASADLGRGSVHRLTLTLTPRLESAPHGKVRVGDKVGGLPPAHETSTG